MTSTKTIDPARLRPYVTHDSAPIYALRNLPEEVVAVLFAYYSRSRESLRENLQRLLDEGDLDLVDDGTLPSRIPGDADLERLRAARDRARAFHEKWVIGYGHSSVAEHAVVHLAIEEVSILTSKRIEDARLASFTEKSTRYVPFDTRRFHTPAPFRAGTAGTVFASGISALMNAYEALMEPLVAFVVRTVPRRPDQTEKGHVAACRAQACDTLRYLLPAATHTNIGMTVNARVLEGLLGKLLADPLEEARAAAEAMKAEAAKVVPTLLKYATPSDYRRERELRMRARGVLPSSDAAPPAGGGPVSLIRWDEDAVDRVALALLYESGASDAGAVRAGLREWTPAARQELIDDALAGRGRHDAVPRAFEATNYLFEVTLDFGAYRDIQRHRIAGQYPQRLTPELGFERPLLFDAAGMVTEFETAVAAAESAWRALSVEHPDEAQYVLPLACRKRLLMEMNLRELHHFIPLRSSPQGHGSYRRVAQAMHRAIAGVHPALAAGIRVDFNDYDLARA